MAQDEAVQDPFSIKSFGDVLKDRKKEADEFYKLAIPCE